MEKQHQYPQHFSECCITCECGHCNRLDIFWQENGEYHCQTCKRSWQITQEGKPKITPSGFVIPAKLRITYTQPA